MGTRSMVIVPYPALLAAMSSQRASRSGTTSYPCRSGMSRRMCSPARQGREFILEGTRDDVAEEVPHVPLEFAMDGGEEIGAGVRAEVVESALGRRRPARGEPVCSPPVAQFGECDRSRGSSRLPPSSSRRRWPVAPYLRAGSNEAGPSACSVTRSMVVPRVRVPRDDLPLEVRAGEPDLVVEPDVHPKCAGGFAGVPEEFPPAVAHERWIVGEMTIERTGRRQADDRQIPDAAFPEALQLYHFAPRRPVAAPPPEGVGRIRGMFPGESEEGG